MENEKSKETKKKIRNYILLPAAIIIGIIVVITNNDDNLSSNTEEVSTEIEFNRVGYYKSDGNLRYFTYYINAPFTINSDSIPNTLFDEIKKHGESQSNTKGQGTASFYYLNKDQTPDITMLQNADEANKAAHNANPVASVWIYPNGKSKLLKWPK